MIIRKAKEKDIPRILELLEQVLQIHADIRPDIFIPGTTKYTIDELRELLKHKEKPIYVAVDEDDVCVGYAFCQLQEQPFSNNMVQFKTFFIDDLCVSQEVRGQHVGESLFEYVKNEAKQIGCYEVTLNVWAGNTSAEKFYEKMGMRTKERVSLLKRELYYFYWLPELITIVVTSIFTAATFHARMYTHSVRIAWLKHAVWIWLMYLAVQWGFAWILGRFIIRKVEGKDE